MCFSPTDKWQDFCNECATREVPEREVAPRLKVIRGGKSSWERPSATKRENRWLSPVAPPSEG
jgi:hypothetical protein